MKRSKINTVIQDMQKLIKKQGFAMPPFADFTPSEWKYKGHEYDEIRDNKLGWDITDFGLGDFDKFGFALFSIRNGNKNDVRYSKSYAEKLLMLYGGQTVAMHYHWSKMEDIINRGGGEVFITVYNANETGERLSSDVSIVTDGKRCTVSAGSKIHLVPGESITITQHIYHDFYVPEGMGPVLLGEVSMCNDDENDNCFYGKVDRFPSIIEDEDPYRFLCNEYPLVNMENQKLSLNSD